MYRWLGRQAASTPHRPPPDPESIATFDDHMLFYARSEQAELASFLTASPRRSPTTQRPTARRQLAPGAARRARVEARLTGSLGLRGRRHLTRRARPRAERRPRHRPRALRPRRLPSGPVPRGPPALRRRARGGAPRCAARRRSAQPAPASVPVKDPADGAPVRAATDDLRGGGARPDRSTGGGHRRTERRHGRPDRGLPRGVPDVPGRRRPARGGGCPTRAERRDADQREPFGQAPPPASVRAASRSRARAREPGGRARRATIDSRVRRAPAPSRRAGIDPAGRLRRHGHARRDAPDAAFRTLRRRAVPARAVRRDAGTSRVSTRPSITSTLCGRASSCSVRSSPATSSTASRRTASFSHRAPRSSP